MRTASKGGLTPDPVPEAPFIPLAVPSIGERERANLEECVRSTFVSTVGPFVDELEKRVAEVSGVPRAVAVSAGTTGLHAALVALGVLPGDLVILPTFTFIASANAISHAGATPWLFDVTPETWTLDAAKVREALLKETERDGAGDLCHTASGRRVSALLPVYTLGIPADMDEITELGRAYRLPVLADAAAAIGCTYRGRAVGGLADLTVYSFNGNKTITTGGGGAIVGPDESLLARLKHLTTTARVGTDYNHDHVGFNYRMTNIEAAVGCAQIERLGEFLAAKTRIRRRYDAAFADLRDRLEPFPDPSDRESANWLSGFVVARGSSPDAVGILKSLNQQRIGARPFWKPVHLQPPYRGAPAAPSPVAEDLWERIITLPCSTNLTEGEQDRVIAALREAVGRA